MNDGAGERPGWHPGADLITLEDLMLAAAATGGFIDLGGGPYTLAEMQAWQDERTVSAPVLRHLLLASDWPADARGVRLRGVRVSGHLDLEAATLRCPLWLDWCYLDAAGPACFDHATVSRVSLTNCRLAGLRAGSLTAKDLVLSHSVFTGVVRLPGAQITGLLNCVGAHLNGRDSEGRALVADGLKAGSVVLAGGFEAAGAVRLAGAEIAGQLNCSEAHLNGYDNYGNALPADWLKASSVLLTGGFEAAGAVRLLGAEIAWQLMCSGAHLNGRDNGGGALVADRLKAGVVSLDKEFTAAGAVRLAGAEIAGQLNCSGAHLNGCDNDGNALVADWLKASSVRLTGGFEAAGAVRLAGAEIAGQLNCNGAHLNGCDNDGNALVADWLKANSVFLTEEFEAAGAVRLSGAEIAGQLQCQGAHLSGRDDDGNALFADGLKVTVISLDKSIAAAGAVRLLHADIAGQLQCHGTHLNGRDNDGNAMVADGLKASSVFLTEGFEAAGAVRLDSAEITGQLVVSRARLEAASEHGDALSASGLKATEVLLVDEVTVVGGISFKSARIDGSILVRPGRLAEGDQAMAFDAQRSRVTGTLLWVPTAPVGGRVNLESAVAGELVDNWTGSRDNGYWPTGGLLTLDGFTYGRIGGGDHATVDQRLDWIRSQYQATANDQPRAFATQPYEQLAAVYRQAGQETQARKIAIAGRADLRRYGNLTPYRKAANWFLDKTIKYGYQTWRAGAGLAVLYLAATALAWLAQHLNLIVPVGDITGLHPVPSALRCTPDYPCFYPAGYAIDTVIPIISVHQASYWGIDGSAAWGWAWVTSTWMFTGLGWAAATLLVAGYTGLIRQQ
jgi:hypothetical protein